MRQQQHCRHPFAAMSFSESKIDARCRPRVSSALDPIKLA